MNENLNLVKILKDCPEGTKFYSRCFGTVEFNKVIQNRYIEIVDNSGCFILYRCNGKLKQSSQDAEIDLFPSKDQRDWGKWHRPFVDGDVVYVKAQFDWIIIKKDGEYITKSYVECDPQNKTISIDSDYICEDKYIKEIRFATEEEKATLFQVIKNNGYKWDPETKTLEKLIVPKFKVGDNVQSKTDHNDKFTITNIDNNKFYYGCGKGHEFMIPVVKQDNWELVSNVTIPKFKDEDKNHLWTIQDAKDGDVLAINWYEGYDYWEKIVIFKKYHNEGATSPCVEGYGNTFKNRKLAFHEEVPRFSKTWTSCLEPATKEQRDLLFQTIKEAGYEWNPETKTLEKLIVPKFKVGDRIKSLISSAYYTVVSIKDNCYYIKYDNEPYPYIISFENEINYELVPNKFDITTLKPFDKVLVRDNNTSIWINAFFGFYDIEITKKYPFVANAINWTQCIPYEGNEHLLGTYEDCDDFYKTWDE